LDVPQYRFKRSKTPQETMPEGKDIQRQTTKWKSDTGMLNFPWTERVQIRQVSLLNPSPKPILKSTEDEQYGFVFHRK
jgi:hypothetical protein